jgi:hypothetical protein
MEHFFGLLSLKTIFKLVSDCIAENFNTPGFITKFKFCLQITKDHKTDDYQFYQNETIIILAEALNFF